jgi:hypothetical protein
MSALPRYFRHQLVRYRQGVIDLYAEIPNRAFDLGMPEQGCASSARPLAHVFRNI